MKRACIGLAAALLCLAATAHAGQKPQLRADRVEIAYVKPVNPAHEPIYRTMQERKVLERVQAYLRPLRLPRVLLVKLAGCDGESNAWYDDTEHTVTVCYEYLDEVLRNAPEQTTEKGVTRDDAIVGPTIEAFLHEIGHAVFDLLKVPVLGREEDAADQLAAYLLLQLGKSDARSTVAGVAYMYAQEMNAQSPGMKHFADVHGLPAQRFYNLICLAYGADPKLFADALEKRYLPESRADGCELEYRQVDYAMKRLILPHVDQKLKNDPARKKMLKRASPAQ
jgi:hypothetical protein